MTENKPVNSGLVCFEVVARINQVDVDLRALAREFAVQDGELAPAELLRIVRNSGFKAKRKSLDLQEISGRYPLPALAYCHDGSFLVLLRVDPEAAKVLVFSRLVKGLKSEPLPSFSSSATMISLSSSTSC